MMRARTAAVLAGTALLALGLTACDKPNPGASVFSGTTSQFQRASCWSFDGASIDATACAKDIVGGAAGGASIPTIPVIPGQVISIRFAYPEFQAVPEEGIVMQILAGKQGSATGVWFFRLVPA